MTNTLMSQQAEAQDPATCWCASRGWCHNQTVFSMLAQHGIACTSVRMVHQVYVSPLLVADRHHCLQVRERDWCNVLTAHRGDTAAYTWRLQHFTLGDNMLQPDVSRGRVSQAPLAPVSAVAISCCGNFGIVGSESGRIDRYNMQSGLHRGAFWR